ncbi:hypothetical protein GGI06_000259 [Coemansia sp. S85]|nr:hypothetical protein GGI06_000259 [Coemansia sp. S85]
MAVTEITEIYELDRMIRKHNRVVAYFTTRQSWSFAQMHLELIRLSSEFRNIEYLLVDVDLVPYVSATYRIPRLPVLISFRDGLEVDSLETDTIDELQDAFICLDAMEGRF